MLRFIRPQPGEHCEAGKRKTTVKRRHRPSGIALSGSIGGKQPTIKSPNKKDAGRAEAFSVNRSPAGTSTSVTLPYLKVYVLGQVGRRQRPVLTNFTVVFTVVFGGFGAGGFNMHRHGMGHKCFGLSYFVCFAIDLRTIGIHSYTV